MDRLTKTGRRTLIAMAVVLLLMLALAALGILR
jgi:hypothetical protein